MHSFLLPSDLLHTLIGRAVAHTSRLYCMWNTGVKSILTASHQAVQIFPIQRWYVQFLEFILKIFLSLIILCLIKHYSSLVICVWSSQLPHHIEILVSAVTQINEPDSLYGIIQSHKVHSSFLDLSIPILLIFSKYQNSMGNISYPQWSWQNE